MKMVRLFVVALTAAAVWLIVPTAHADPGPRYPAVLPADVSAEGAGYANTILVKVNELRSGLGLKPVTRIAELDVIAQDWSEQMASRNSMEHRPNLGSNYPQGFLRATENVAWRSGGGDIGALIFEQWRNSPGHYTNMTDPDADSLGIGVAYDPGSGSWYATQNFANYGGDPVGKGLTASSGGSGQSAGGSGAENVRSTTSTSTAESDGSDRKRTSRSGERQQSEKTESATPTQETETSEAVETPEATETPEVTETPSETPSPEATTPTPTQTVTSPDATPTPSAPSSSAAPVAAAVPDGSVSPIIWMGTGALVVVSGMAAVALVRRVRLRGASPAEGRRFL